LILPTLRANDYPQWHPLGPWGGSARVIRLDNANPNTMMALTMRGAGVFRSADGGENWHECLNFPVLPGARLDCGLITRTPTSTWFAGAAPGGLWLSHDEGETWQQSPGTEPLSVYAIGAWPKDPRVLALGTNQGVWLSSDNAKSWRRISPAAIADLAAIVSVAFHPRLAGTIYAGTPHLPWKTTDGGATWRRASTGMFDDSDIFSIEIDPANPERVFASACSGIYCSLNGGVAWRRAQGIPGTNRRTYVVTQDPHNPQRLYAGTSAGMWTSTDQGLTWRKLNEHVATSIAFHPARKDCFYASTERDGLLFTNDAGKSFSPRHQGFVSRSILRIHDEAGSWTPARELDSEPRPANGPPQAFEVRRDPFAESRLLAATPRGLEQSTDNGASWNHINNGLGEGWIRSIAFHPKQQGRIFALRGQRTFWTSDNGTNWYWLPANESVRSGFRRLEVPRSEPNKLLALSEDRGIYGYTLPDVP
jgi:photosystem II stability/assembly factor-like uncharacterized protein